MKYIALIVFIVFIYKLFKADHEAAPNLSKAMWIPTLWFLYCATRPISLWLAQSHAEDTGDVGVEGGSFWDRNFLSVLLLIGFIVLAKKKVNWVQAIKNNPWLYLLFFYMLVSICWSDYPFSSLKRYVRTAGSAVIAMVILSEAEPYEAIHTILRRVIYLVIPGSMVVVKYFPQYGISFGRWSGEPSYEGITETKNTLGEICAMSIFLAVWSYFAKKEGKAAGPIGTRPGITAVFMFFVLYLMKGPSGYGSHTSTYSATSILVLMIALGVFLLLRQFRERLAQLSQRLMLGGAVGLIFILVMAALDTSPQALVAMCLGRNADLTGRSNEIWDVLLPLAHQHFLLGVGYGAFWIAPVPNLILAVNEAHNGYLDVYIELGVVGLLLLLPVFISYFMRAVREFPKDFMWASFRIAFLLLFLVHNWSETTLLRSRELFWNLFVMFMVVYPGEWTGTPALQPVAPEESEPLEATVLEPAGKAPV